MDENNTRTRRTMKDLIATLDANKGKQPPGDTRDERLMASHRHGYRYMPTTPEDKDGNPQSYLTPDGKYLEIWTGSYHYPIEMERFTDSAQVLDMVFQVAFKVWDNKHAAMDLLLAVHDACDIVFHESPQGVFCPFGEGQKVDWKKKSYREKKR